jgi:hypothetical protein
LKNKSTLTTQAQPRPLDLALVVIGPILLAAGYDMLKGALFYTVMGLAAGCALGALAWRWPRAAGPGLIVLSIPGMFEGLVFTLYTLGMPQALVMLWGAAALLTGGIGVLRRRAAVRQPIRHFVVGSLAAVFLLYFVMLWPPQGKAILLNLPILEQGEPPQIHTDAGGIWAAYWPTAQVTIAEALENIKGPLEADGWTIVDSSVSGHGRPLISAQRGAYSLEVIYEPVPLGPDDKSTGASMAVYVRRAQARVFPEVYPEVTAPATKVKEGK